MMYDFKEPMFVTDEASEIPEVARGLAEMSVRELLNLICAMFTDTLW
jgi:hypothetical protein